MLQIRPFIRPLVFALAAAAVLGGGRLAQAQAPVSVSNPFDSVDDRQCPAGWAGTGSYVCVGLAGPSQVGATFSAGIQIALDSGASNVQGRTTFIVPAGLQITAAEIGPAPFLDGSCDVPASARDGNGGTVVCTLANLAGPAYGAIAVRGNVNLPLGQTRDIEIRHRAGVIFNRTVTITGAGLAPTAP